MNSIELIDGQAEWGRTQTLWKPLDTSVAATEVETLVRVRDVPDIMGRLDEEGCLVNFRDLNYEKSSLQVSRLTPIPHEEGTVLITAEVRKNTHAE